MPEEDNPWEWNRMIAYIAPEILPDSITNSDAYLNDLEACALTMPFVLKVGEIFTQFRSS